jgi:flagella basal body P-ring formation protein FlgA
MAVWLDVHVSGKFVRSVLIGFRVRAYSQAWTASADLAAGTRLNRQLLERREVDVTSAGGMPWNGDPNGRVLRTRLLSSNYLPVCSVAPALAVSRGDVVHLRSRIGGVEVVAEARALQDANVSQTVRLRVDAARGPVLATVLEPGWAEIAQ